MMATSEPVPVSNAQATSVEYVSQTCLFAVHLCCWPTKIELVEFDHKDLCTTQHKIGQNRS